MTLLKKKKICPNFLSSPNLFSLSLLRPHLLLLSSTAPLPPLSLPSTDAAIFRHISFTGVTLDPTLHHPNPSFLSSVFAPPSKPEPYPILLPCTLYPYPPSSISTTLPFPTPLLLYQPTLIRRLWFFFSFILTPNPNHFLSLSLFLHISPDVANAGFASSPPPSLSLSIAAQVFTGGAPEPPSKPGRDSRCLSPPKIQQFRYLIHLLTGAEFLQI